MAVRSDTKESRESSSKLKSKHKLSGASSDSERAHKEGRHESYGRDRSQADAEKVQKRDDGRETVTERAQHRDEKRSDGRMSADVDARLKDRSHRTDVDTDDRGHRALSADVVMSGNRSGDVHRRSADSVAGKPADERGMDDRICASEMNYVFYVMLLVNLHVNIIHTLCFSGYLFYE